MATSFDEVLLDTSYSAIAEGGPEFATAIIRSGSGGAVSHRAANREDFISRYQVDYQELIPARQKALRQFAVLRQGMARGFRFLAPDAYSIDFERLGQLNAASGEIVRSPSDGSTKRFFIIEYFADETSSYLRWLVKPSRFDDFLFTLAADSSPDEILVSKIVAGSPGGGGSSLTAGISIDFGSQFGTANFYYNLGILEFQNAPAANHFITATGVFHTPVTFVEDWQKFKIDESGIGEFNIQVEELLPVELGITPSMSFTGNITPAPPTNATADDAQNAAGWTNSSDFPLTTDYEYSVDFGASHADATTNPIGVGNANYAFGQVRVRVKAAPGRNASAWLLFPAFTATAGNAAPTASNVAISGTKTVGQTLTGSYVYADAESNSEGASVYKWYRANSSSGAGASVISGATNSNYLLQAADAGKFIRFSVTPVASSGTSTGVETFSAWTSAAVANVTPPAPTNATADDSLNTAGWTNAVGFPSQSDYEYSVNAGGSTADATTNPVDVGNANYAAGDVRVRVKSASGRNASAWLLFPAYTVTGGNAAPTASSVAISGTKTVGQTLTGSYVYADAESNAEGTSTFKWYRADSSTGTNATAITGATSITYVLQAGDAGKYIRFSVKPIASAGNTTGAETFSAWTTAAVSNSAPPPSEGTGADTMTTGDTGADVMTDSSGNIMNY